MANSKASFFWLKGTALAHTKQAHFRWDYIYKRGRCTQNQIVMIQPLQANKNPVNFLSSQVNSSGVSTSLSTKLPSRKRLKEGSSTFSLEIFLLWWGVTLLHDMKESEASEPVLKGGEKKILLWTQSCCNDTSAHFSAFPSMAILPTPLFSSAHSLALLHGVGIVPAMLCLQQL